jgi:hypothetical protein
VKNHQVAQGEGISSIAFENGFFADTIWDHASNNALREKRKDMNSLVPGDMVVIPDKEPKDVEVATNARHSFKLKGAPAKVSIRLLQSGEPRKDEPYELEIDGEIQTGRTDANGVVRFTIPPNAKTGRLIVGENYRQTEHMLDLGRLDPAGELRVD